MANPYSMGAYPNNVIEQYPQNNNYTNNDYPANRGPSTLGMMALGGIGTGAVGYFRHRYPVNKNGTVSDEFAHKVFEKDLAKNGTDKVKGILKNLKDILKELKKVKDPEKLKELLNNHKNCLDSLKGITSDVEDFINSINANNIKEKAKFIQENLQNKIKLDISNVKDFIKNCWDKKEKKFVLPEGSTKEELFKVIKNTANNTGLKNAGKYGLIGAATAGILTMGYKMFAPLSNKQQ